MPIKRRRSGLCGCASMGAWYKFIEQNKSIPTLSWDHELAYTKISKRPHAYTTIHLHHPYAGCAQLHRLTRSGAAQRIIPVGVRAQLLGWARGIPGRLLEYTAGSHKTYHQHTYDMGMITMCMHITMLIAHGNMTTYTFYWPSFCVGGLHIGLLRGLDATSSQSLQYF